MGVIFMDGFDAGDFAMKWGASSVTTTDTTRYNSGKAIVNTAVGGYVRHAFPATAHAYCGFAFNPAFATGNVAGFYSDGGTRLHLSLRVTAQGTIAIYRGASSFLVSGAIPSNAWSYVEWDATIAESGGVSTVKVNGVEVINFLGDTRDYSVSNLTVDALGLGGNASDNSSTSFAWDDVYISDSGFLGEIRIQTLVPTAAGSSTQLTPTGGANYANVADIPDSTATYNASSTVGNKDLYALGDLAAGTASVKCIQVNTHSWKDDAGVASLKTKIKSGVTEVSGATTSLPSSVAWTGDVWETDPNTSTAWTVSGVNALEAGAEVA